MQKEITVKDIETTINEYENISEPIIIKRKNKSDLMIISVEEFNKRTALYKLEKEIDEAERDIEKGRVFSAKNVFEELGKKYDY